MKKKQIVLILLAIVIIAAGITGFVLWNKAPEQAEDKKATEVTVQELTAAYANNEKEANATYLNQVLEVTGTVTETEENQDGSLMIVLDDNVQCSMRDKNAKPEKGATVTVKGFCSGSNLFGVSLTGCIIKDK